MHEPENAPTALLTTRELCEQLRCSETTIRRMVHEGLPRVRLVDSPRYDLAEVLAWMRDRR